MIPDGAARPAAREDEALVREDGVSVFCVARVAAMESNKSTNTYYSFPTIQAVVETTTTTAAAATSIKAAAVVATIIIKEAVVVSLLLRKTFFQHRFRELIIFFSL